MQFVLVPNVPSLVSPAPATNAKEGVPASVCALDAVPLQVREPVCEQTVEAEESPGNFVLVEEQPGNSAVPAVCK